MLARSRTASSTSGAGEHALKERFCCWHNDRATMFRGVIGRLPEDGLTTSVRVEPRPNGVTPGYRRARPQHRSQPVIDTSRAVRTQLMAGIVPPRPQQMSSGRETSMRFVSARSQPAHVVDVPVHDDKNLMALSLVFWGGVGAAGTPHPLPLWGKWGVVHRKSTVISRAKRPSPKVMRALTGQHLAAGAHISVNTGRLARTTGQRPDRHRTPGTRGCA